MFPAKIYTERLHKAQELAAKRGISAVIVTPGPDFAYLTGSWMSSHERLSAVVIPATGTVCAVVPATDAFEVHYLSDWGVNVLGWTDGQDPHGLVLEQLSKHTAETGENQQDNSAIAVSSAMTADHLLRLQKLSGKLFVPANSVLAELFTVKDSAEIEQLDACARAIDAVHAQVPALLQPGSTENDVAEKLHELILKEHSSVDFVIVGSGPNGANPHHSHSDRVLEEGDVVVVDLGGTFGVGYHSDCTRTYIVGGRDKASPEVIAAYDVLYAAQLNARELASPGISAQAVDAAARSVIAEAGFGEYFTHRTGHGIGLSTHEEPFIMAGNSLELEENMAFSIEPGIYVPGKWGMRLEDIVVTTADGIRSLNQAPRELR
ncbi:peptidase M24 [Corynebacterium phocae]|uniref:Peptidase M24 n=1 Tax=Corynebacterium phocae TaxID=161895 RepID=A0A1L7D357_9CORY|nr:Xaa-Pro peptidase family protein [Corynebacterium phocae]APT92535.1 peptidase M24 [Corynebacterium phocae]KAA8725138.1 aminopeptidase P family protein [Corynebacterium phocae]